MAFFASPAGEAKALTGIVTAEALTLKLYSACATSGGVPSAASVVGDFTEAVFTSYAAKTLTGTVSGSTWSAPSGTPAQTQYNSTSPQSWTATGAYQTILGYYYVGVSTGTYYGAEAFASGIALSSGQPTMTLIPTLKQGTSPAPTS